MLLTQNTGEKSGDAHAVALAELQDAYTKHVNKMPNDSTVMWKARMWAVDALRDPGIFSVEELQARCVGLCEGAAKIDSGEWTTPAALVRAWSQSSPEAKAYFAARDAFAKLDPRASGEQERGVARDNASVEYVRAREAYGKFLEQQRDCAGFPTDRDVLGPSPWTAEFGDFMPLLSSDRMQLDKSVERSILEWKKSSREYEHYKFYVATHCVELTGADGDAQVARHREEASALAARARANYLAWVATYKRDGATSTTTIIGRIRSMLSVLEAQLSHEQFQLLNFPGPDDERVLGVLPGGPYVAGAGNPLAPMAGRG